MKYFFSVILSVFISLAFVQSGQCQKKESVVPVSALRFQKELNMSPSQVTNVLIACKLNRDQFDVLLKDQKMEPRKRMQMLLQLTHQRDSAVNSYLTAPQRERFVQLIQNALGDKRAEIQRRAKTMKNQVEKQK